MRLPLVPLAAVAVAIGFSAAPDPLRVLRTAPGDVAAPLDTLTVSFDRPVAGALDDAIDARTVLDITPVIAGRYEWRDPVTVRVIPARPLPRGQRYTVRVSAEFRAMDGSALAAPYEFAFRVRGPTLIGRRSARRRTRDGTWRNARVHARVRRAGARRRCRPHRVIPAAACRDPDGRALSAIALSPVNDGRAPRDSVTLRAARALPANCLATLEAPRELALRPAASAPPGPRCARCDGRSARTARSRLTACAASARRGARTVRCCCDSPRRCMVPTSRAALAIAPAVPLVLRHHGRLATAGASRRHFRPRTAYALITSRGPARRVRPVAHRQPERRRAHHRLRARRAGALRTAHGRAHRVPHACGAHHEHRHAARGTAGRCPTRRWPGCWPAASGTGGSIWHARGRARIVQHASAAHTHPATGHALWRCRSGGTSIAAVRSTTRGWCALARSLQLRTCADGCAERSRRPSGGDDEGRRTGTAWRSCRSPTWACTPRSATTPAGLGDRCARRARARRRARGTARCAGAVLATRRHQCRRTGIALQLRLARPPPRESRSRPIGSAGTTAAARRGLRHRSALRDDRAVLPIRYADPDLAPWRFGLSGAYGTDRATIAAAVFTERDLYRPGEIGVRQGHRARGCHWAHWRRPRPSDTVRWIRRDREYRIIDSMDDHALGVRHRAT